MREEFHANLQAVSRLLVEMAQAVRVAMKDATTALLNADKDLAASVAAGDAAVDDLRRRVEELALETTARHAPVASDLRRVFTAIRVAANLERMGDLASHVARSAERRHPHCAVPAELRDIVHQMAEVADRMAVKVASVLANPDALSAAELDHDDDAMDQLHRDLLATMLRPDSSQGTQAAIDAALLGRFYERYGDHAVNAGRQIVFLLSGEPIAHVTRPGPTVPPSLARRDIGRRAQ